MTQEPSTVPKEELVWHPPFRSFVHYVEATFQLAALSREGIHALVGLRNVSKEFGVDELVASSTDPKDAAAKTHRDESAEMAETEIGNGFRMLHTHALVGLWSALEVLIDDVAAAWIERDPQLLGTPAFSKIRVPLGKVISLTPAEQRSMLVEELKRETKSDIREGLGQFENLLAAIGLGGAVDPRIRKVLFEAQAIRNVVAHRAGRIDTKFLEKCPDLGQEVGDLVSLGPAEFSRISNCVYLYGLVVLNRCRKRDGIELTFTCLDETEFEGAVEWSAGHDRVDGTA